MKVSALIHLVQCLEVLALLILSNQLLNSLVHCHFVDERLVRFILLFELCLLGPDEISGCIEVFLDHIVKQELLIQLPAFACLLDPVLELVEILALSHFDLKLFVKSLEIAVHNKELLELIEIVKNNLQNLLH